MHRPRNKNKFKVDYGLKDAYRYYRILDKDNLVTYEIFSKIVTEFNEAVMDVIIEKAGRFRLPGRLGDIRIKKKKNVMDVNYLKPDWKACWKLWEEIYSDKTEDEIVKIPNKKIVYHLNDHSDNYYYKFYWDKATCNVRNNTAYCFIPTRTNKEKLVHQLKLKTDYFE